MPERAAHKPMASKSARLALAGAERTIDRLRAERDTLRRELALAQQEIERLRWNDDDPDGGH